MLDRWREDERRAPDIWYDEKDTVTGLPEKERSMLPATQISLYSDVHRPYAYLTAYRLRTLREEYRGKIVIVYRSLALVVG